MTPPAQLRRVPLDGSPDPVAACLHLRDDEHPVALVGSWAGGGAILASEPVRVARPGQDPFALLDEQPDVAGAGPEGAVGGGWLGFLGFGLGALIERVPPPPPRPVPLPAFALAFYDHVVRWDGERWCFEALWTPERAAVLDERLERWRARIAGPPAPARPFAAGALDAVAPGRTGHAAAVAACRERIAAGEIFQANLCLRLEAPFEGDALDLFARAAGELRPSHAAYVAGPWGALASLSPERFLRRTGRTVTTDPIKGTAPRETDPALLAGSAKDRAENVMIADLMRNDLGRVAAYGSVGVEALAEVRPASGVWHLVSTVRATLRDGVGDADLLRASFPPGSITGAPKVQALRVIAELEATGREAYCGAIGLASPLAGLDLSVAIRTFEVAAGRIWLGAGGGVVADSDPQAEVAEALTKAAPLAAAAGIALRDPQGAGRAVPSLPFALAGGRDRPDPALGILETLRVAGGEPELLDERLARLARSAAALGLALPHDLRDRVLSAARNRWVQDPTVARLRIEVDGDGTRVATFPGGDVPDEVVLVPYLLPGGLGAHKWADRRLVDALSGEGTTPLFVDLDGSVLEAGYAAVCVERDGELLTPPADGRILPSVTAAAAGARPHPLTLADLAGGTVLLASAVRGLHRGRLSGAAATA